MTSIEYLRAHAITIAWTEGHKHGCGAMVGVLEALRNRADRDGGWVASLDSQWSVWCGVVDLANTHDPDFRRLAAIADQIVTDETPCPRPLTIGTATEWSERPGAPGAVKLGGLYFW